MAQGQGAEGGEHRRAGQSQSEAKAGDAEQAGGAGQAEGAVGHVDGGRAQAVPGIIAASIALIGFGLDWVIKFSAAAVVVWQLRGTVSEERETRALRLIGVTFFALAADLTIESITDLVSQQRSRQSTAGIAVTGAALVIMPATRARQAARRPAAGQPDPDRGCRRKRILCPHLRCRSDRHRGLNAWLGWWWADCAGRGVHLDASPREVFD